MVAFAIWHFILLLSILLYYYLYSKVIIEYPVHKLGVILVTGASTGIGRHAVEYLANNYEGLIVFAGVRNEESMRQLQAIGLKNLIPIRLDVTAPEDCIAVRDSIISFVTEKEIPFIALVNNAGVASMYPAEYHPLDDMEYTFRVNFFGLMHLTQLFLPLVRRSQGRIVMMSSTAGYIAAPLKSIYAASKFAVEGFSDALRREMAPFRVSVSIVEPAFVKSEILNSVKSVNVRKVSNEQDMLNIYGERIVRSSEYARVAHPKADDPIVTSRCYEDAIMSRTPKTRYFVGNDDGTPGWVLGLLGWVLSDRLQDWHFFT
jgi:short-subunit dehydrogenase